MKFEYIVAYENSLDQFNNNRTLSDQGQGHCRPLKVSPFTTIQTFRSHNLALVQARKLILITYVHLIILYKIYKYCHA